MGSLFKKIQTFAFKDMQKLFFHYVLHPPHLVSLGEAERQINDLPRKKSELASPSDDSIRSGTTFLNARVIELLVRLRSCNVSDLRNIVVHKSAYRPTLDEVSHALKETQEILIPLGLLLDVRVDDVYAYMRPPR